MELLREVLHAVVKVRRQHHFELLGIDLAALIHHEIRGARGFKIEAVIGAICIAETQQMTELMGAFLLEGVAVITLSYGNDTGVISGPVQGQCFQLEGLQKAPSPAPE